MSRRTKHRVDGGARAANGDHDVAAATDTPAQQSGGTREPAKEVEWAGFGQHPMSSAVEEFHGGVDVANVPLAKSEEVETAEADLGQMMVEARSISAISFSRLELQIHEVLCEAEAKATRILTEATDEAHEIRRQSQEVAMVSKRAADELQVTIAGFSAVNVELIKQLGALHSALARASGLADTSDSD
jgi:hypothetical protein